MPSFEEFRDVVKFGKEHLDSEQLSRFDFVASVILGQNKTKGTPVVNFKSVGATWLLHWIDESMVDFDSALRFIESRNIFV